jgi:aryl-alcohol dehydrogenase-like predicted oxidoreductase
MHHGFGYCRVPARRCKPSPLATQTAAILIITGPEEEGVLASTKKELPMEKRRLGRTDMQVSVLGFGGAEIGFQKAAGDTVARLLNAALDAGLNVIDTAECYLQSEELVGQAIAGRRKDYYLFTKCGHPVTMAEADWRPEALLRMVERSLKRLRTDRLDLIQLHSCSEAELRKGDVIEALRDARQRGYARYIGYSGDGSAARYAIECGQFDTLQISVSIADQEALDLTLSLAQQKEMGVIAKRPIANAVWLSKDKPENSYYQPYWERLRKLGYPLLSLSKEAAVATALRFTLSVSGVHTAIVGTTKPGRWRENADMLAAGALPSDQYERIRARWREIADASWVGQV